MSSPGRIAFVSFRLNRDECRELRAKKIPTLRSGSESSEQVVGGGAGG